MKYNESVLKSEERIAFLLRSLYKSCGYRQFKMSKFEEYDLYANNKDFLISDNIITFTDTNGRLMALKPDVTLSIVRNTRDAAGGRSKVYYDENVYRVSGSARGFREIQQTGLECIGEIDDYSISEVVWLAAASLSVISEHYLLNLSHLGILSELLQRLQLSAADERKALQLIGEKNTHELRGLLTAAGVPQEAAAPLWKVLSASGTPKEVLPVLEACGCFPEAVERLRSLAELLESTEAAGHIVMDFSVVNDMSYYNGIVFRGYIEGVPTGILSGGQYDRLLRKMGKQSGAIGFAVYLDFLERFFDDDTGVDVDVILLYEGDTDPALVFGAVRRLTEEGLSVTACRQLPDKLRASRVMRISPEGVLETVPDAII